MSEQDLTLGDSKLEEQIRKQVDRCGEAMKGDLEGLQEEDLTKYLWRTHQSVQHLHDLVSPIAGDDYEDSIEQINEKYPNRIANDVQVKKVIELNSEKFRNIVQMLHEEGIL